MTPLPPEYAFSVTRTDLNGSGFTIHVDGEVDLSNAARFREELERAIDGAASTIVLDFRPCRFIDSSGLAVLLELGDRQREHGLQLGLIASGQSQKLFELTGVFESGVFAASEPPA